MTQENDPMPRTPATTRFAPSPSGRLHLGHAYAALFAEARARDGGGTFLLRIEDIDGGRSRPEYETAICEDLAWLGVRWDGAVRRQSEHFDAYRCALAALENSGLLYPCFCTRKEIAAEIAASVQAPQGPEGPVYPGTCRTLSPDERADRVAAGRGFALRLNMDAAWARAREMTGARLAFVERGRGALACDARPFGDVVLARKVTPASYHLAVVVDDAAQGVTLVTRGEDLFPATHIHRTLQTLLGLPVPDYEHHKLIADENGTRLATRTLAATLSVLREKGATPAGIRERLGF